VETPPTSSAQADLVVAAKAASWALCVRRQGPFLIASTLKQRNGRPSHEGANISTEPRINDRIRVPQVRLVGVEGEQIGVVDIDEALRLAIEADLDLVEVAPDAQPPVCKIMDFGKYKYEAAQKAREARKNQTHIVVKEMKLRPKIDSHDYETKKGHVIRFLKSGDKVKITIMFRGREQSRPELGYKLLQRLAEDVADIAFIEFAPKQDGRNMVMVLGPSRGGKPASLPKLVTTPVPVVVEDVVENSSEEVS